MILIKLFLLPVFLHVILVLYVGNKMVRARVAAVKEGRTKRSDIATNSANWPDDVRKLGNNFDSQFDLPTTWYAASGLIIALGKVDWIFVAMSWLFIATRIAHTYVHIGDNIITNRKKFYTYGLYAMLVIWAWFAIKLFFDVNL